MRKHGIKIGLAYAGLAAYAIGVVAFWDRYVDIFKTVIASVAP